MVQRQHAVHADDAGRAYGWPAGTVRPSARRPIASSTRASFSASRLPVGSSSSSRGAFLQGRRGPARRAGPGRRRGHGHVRRPEYPAPAADRGRSRRRAPARRRRPTAAASGVWLAEEDVVGQSAVEQRAGSARSRRSGAPPVLEIRLRKIDAVEADMAQVGPVEAKRQTDRRRLAGSGRPGERHALPRLHAEADAVKRRPVPAVEAQRHALEGEAGAVQAGQGRRACRLRVGRGASRISINPWAAATAAARSW